MPLPTTIQAALADMRGFVDSYDWSDFSQKRLDILRVFLRHAAAQGYSAISMRSLAAELNIKAPSIYSHFPGGKDAIIVDSLRWQASLFGSEILNATAGAIDSADFLGRLTRLHCRMNLEHRENFLWDMIVASDRIGKFLPIELRNEMQDWINHCTRLYAEAGKALGYEDCELKARQVMAAIDSVNSWGAWDESEADLQRILGEATHLCGAITAAPPRSGAGPGGR